MINYKDIQEIQKLKRKKKFLKILPYGVFFFIFFASYFFRFEYNENTELFIDKLVDVGSIFFGIFIGCIYLFEKFKENTTYIIFLRFCKLLLYQNIVIIIFSFLIILVNDQIIEQYVIKKTIIYPRVGLFSIYVAFFSVIMTNMIRFISIMLKLLRYK